MNSYLRIMRIVRLAFSIVTLTLSLAVSSAFGQVRGEPAAIATAESILQQVGGREAWRHRTLEVLETVYLPNGETGQLRIWRDFESGSRLFERRTPTGTFREWVAPGEGWITRNGAHQPMPASELAAERYGMPQEPYAVYHRLARNDPALRFELRENGASLFVFDGEERLLCWFRLAPNGVLRGWGNFFDGRINEHYYGPLDDVGDANLPRFGAAANGTFRFEYHEGRLSNAPLTEPAPDAAFR